MTEIIEDTVQPDNAVTADSEIKQDFSETSQAEESSSTEAEEFIIKVEDSQNQTSNFNTDTAEYKAFRKEKEAKRRKQKIIDDMLAREKAREEELNQLKETVSKLAAPAKPTLESCDYDYEKLETELAKFYQQQQSSHVQDTTANQANPSVNSGGLNEVFEYQHFKNEQKLKKSFKDYDEATQAFKSEFHQIARETFDPNCSQELAVNALIEHGSMANVDMSKALLALSKVPALKAELFNSETLRNPIAVADVLRKAEKAIKSAKSVQAKPAAEIRQGGPVDNVNAQVKQLYDQWGKTGSIEDFKAYKAAKKLAKKR